MPLSLSSGTSFPKRSSPLSRRLSDEFRLALRARRSRLWTHLQQASGPRELEKILNQLDAGEIRSLRSNSGMASRLAYHQAITGDWREIVRKRNRVAKVTPDDIRRVATTYFVKSNRVVATLVKPAPTPPEAAPTTLSSPASSQ